MWTHILLKRYNYSTKARTTIPNTIELNVIVTTVRSMST